MRGGLVGGILEAGKAAQKATLTYRINGVKPVDGGNAVGSSKGVRTYVSCSVVARDP